MRGGRGTASRARPIGVENLWYYSRIKLKDTFGYHYRPANSNNSTYYKCILPEHGAITTAEYHYVYRRSPSRDSRQRYMKYLARRKDHRSSLNHPHISGQICSWSVWSSSCHQMGAPKSTRSRTCFLGWTCIIQILHNFSWRQDIVKIVWTTPWPSQRVKSLDCCKLWKPYLIIFDVILYRVSYSTACRLASKLPSGMTALRTTSSIALLNIRVVTQYLTIIIFTCDDDTIAVGYTTFRSGTTAVCCDTIWNYKCKASASNVLLQKFIQGKAATAVFLLSYIVHWSCDRPPTSAKRNRRIQVHLSSP